MKLIGWVPVDESGEAVRPWKYHYITQARINLPPRIYQTESMAKRFGDSSKPVYMGDEE